MADNTSNGGKFKRGSTLELALDYLERHLYTRYLFAIAPSKKFPPCLKDNLDGNASNDPEQIREWHKRWPGCNWGLAHRKSNVMAIDVDTNPKKGKVGQKTYDGLDLAYGFPDTETTTTPSGGFHKIYTGPHVMALGENGIGKDIDSPNYTLIPGCTFDDGTSYIGNGAEAVKCPQWIYDVIKGTKAKNKARLVNAGDVVVELDKPENIEIAIDFLQNDAEPAIEGSGGDFNTLKTAMYLKDLGISPPLAVDMMVEYYNPRCIPPWTRDDLERKVANAFNYSSLSKAGGKTAEADFSDDPPEPIKPMGDAEEIARQVAARAATQGKTKAAKFKRANIRYSPQDMPEVVKATMVAIKEDRVHDRIFRRGPDVVRLNQLLTDDDFELTTKKVKRKRGSLMIREAVPNYMALRIGEAAVFWVKAKPMGRPKTEKPSTDGEI